MPNPDNVLHYWISELGQAGWYAGGEAIDAEIRTRFLETWNALMRGECDHWLCGPHGTLAYLIVADQFPRNMFRGDARAFASDARARAAVHRALARDFDLEIPEPERQFFYLPLEHSESKADQDRCVRLMKTRMSQASENLLHARAHREIIRRFGRFPFRNAAMGRTSTDAERQFMSEGAYGAIVQKLQA